MSNYQKNRLRARTENYELTKADQSAAPSTDINVIVRNARVHGQIPTGKQPIYGDFSELPTTLQEALDLGHRAAQARADLPPALRGMTPQELIEAQPSDLLKRIKDYDVVAERRAKLPAHLKDLPATSVLALTDEQLAHILAPARPNEPPKEPK